MAKQKYSNKYLKDFGSWNEFKQRYQDRDFIPPLYNEREIWWTSVGVNLGFEEDGKAPKFLRPVLIVKKFNRELFVGVPMSTKLKKNKYYYEIIVNEKTVSVLLSQLRAFSSRRLEDKLSKIEEKDFDKLVKEMVNVNFSLPPL
jgi:mRNA interferase MazF